MLKKTVGMSHDLLPSGCQWLAVSNRDFDEANIGDMTPQEREEAGMGPPGKVSRHIEKLGKAFQNWREVQLKRLADMQKKKIFFACWRREENMLCMQDLIWTEADMDYFLHTVASFETHKRHWLATKKARAARSHRDYGKEMPQMVPPSYVRLFQLALSETHCAKLREHFGAMKLDGTLHMPLLLRSSEVDDPFHFGWPNQLPAGGPGRASSSAFSQRTPTSWPSMTRPVSWITPRT